VERFARAAQIRRRWLLSAISFWGDESGSHHVAQGVFVLSGYLASDDSWNAFGDAWEKALQEEPTIEFLHMREYFKLEKTFEGMNKFQAERKLNTMIDVLRSFLKTKQLREFTAFMPWDVFDRAVHGPVKCVRGNPYYFLLRAVIDQINVFVSSDPEWMALAPVEYFFDEQSAKLEFQVPLQFETVKSIVGNKALMGGISFRDDEINYPLQAADVIAWERRRRALNLPEDLGERKTLKRLRTVTSGALMLVNEEKLRALSDEILQAVRIGKIKERPQGEE
jgi:hypothetical protein